MVGKLKVILACFCLGALVGAWPSSGQYGGLTLGVNITTDRIDNFNSAWNPNETILNTSNAGSVTLKHTVAVDDQVDAQVLIYKGSMYVVTENDTIYRIDAKTGVIKAHRTVGTPVPASVSGCVNNGPNIGITSTPVIDPTTNIVYFIAYQYPANVPTYKIYGVDAGSLNDRITPQTISLSGSLTDASTYAFNATVSRQRSALKLANGNIFAGFASFCDFFASTTRGWMLGFNKSTLSLALANGVILDRFNPDVTDSPPFYLNSVWMSGAGPVIDASNNLFITTGNSGSGPAGWVPTTNLSCSIVRLSPTLAISDYWQNTAPNACEAPGGDNDASGMGAVALPDIPNCVQDYRGVGGTVVNCVHLISIGSKGGCCTILNRDILGFTSGSGLAISSVVGNTGFYTPTYYYGSDNFLRFAFCQDGGGGEGFFVKTVTITLTFANSEFNYTQANDQTIGTALNGTGGLFPNQGFQGGQDGCGNWMVSSNSTAVGSAVLWVVSRPDNTGNGTELSPKLYAMDPTTGGRAALLQVSLPIWATASLGGNMNADPVVANGQVYFCTYQACVIYGL